MKILHLQYRTSAASPANRLHQAFIDNGLESEILTLYGDNIISPGIQVLGRNTRLKAKANNYIQSYVIKNKISEFGMFSYPIVGSNIATRTEVLEADVIYIHWVLYGFLSIKNLRQLASLGKPLIFVMHDMWNITGGCHHSFECPKYESHCNNCQFFEGNKTKDISYKGFKKKQKFYNDYENLYFVSPSAWLFKKAQKSALTGKKPIFHIGNMLSASLFKPIDKKVAKQILNVDGDMKIIAFGAMAVDSPYKGWAYLKRALHILLDSGYRNFKILVFGSGQNSEIADAMPYDTKFVGFVDSEYATSVIYNAADVFVAPSLADNLPYTILESLSCGTPVVAFNVGGIPELIKHRLNGYLAEQKNADDLAKGIKYCVDEKVVGRRLPEFDEKFIIEKHFKLLNQVTS
ncbi:glycosyltransferase [Muriicola sp. Z0-33]|uniref:glycosyltransferase n=1 Tax=Muriicola sp. Z0-33 TaxID=2816957 RepID=UPI0022383249|nr:glycosyltransferase [Muriicola sp. Z0-33]MCW5518000.1 glycosyltransferase [Muriicola sp. Z0-33]